MARTILARTESMLMCSGLVIEQLDTSNEVKHCCIRDIYWSVMGLRVCVWVGGCVQLRLCAIVRVPKASQAIVDQIAVCDHGQNDRETACPSTDQSTRSNTHPPFVLGQCLVIHMQFLPRIMSTCIGTCICLVFACDLEPWTALEPGHRADHIVVQYTAA